LLLLLFLGLLSQKAPVLASETSVPDSQLSGTGFRGYTLLLPFGSGFLASGSDGRVDELSDNGKRISVSAGTGIPVTDMVVSDEGVYWIDAQRTVHYLSTLDTTLKKEVTLPYALHCLCRFKGSVWIGSNDGVLLKGGSAETYRPVQLPLKGNFVSLSSNSKGCFGITDQGEIVQSKNGTDWSVLDFNEYYQGYYPTARLRQILALEDRIVLLGEKDGQKPIVLVSADGNVWTERELVYTDERGYPAVLSDAPIGLIYDALEDQIVLCCTKGKLLFLPSCSHCNQCLTWTASDIQALAENGGRLVAVGKDFQWKTLRLP
jgi:hypothetical protein